MARYCDECGIEPEELVRCSQDFYCIPCSKPVILAYYAKLKKEGRWDELEAILDRKDINEE